MRTPPLKPDVEMPASALREIGGGGLRHRPLNGK